MANRNGHMTDDITLPERSSHEYNTFRDQYLENSGDAI